MEISIKKSFEYIKNDPDLVKKIGIVYLFALGTVIFAVAEFIVGAVENVANSKVPILAFVIAILSLLYSFFYTFVMQGYFASTINQRLVMPNSHLPEWSNIKSIFIRGAKLYLPVALTTIVCILLFAIPIFASGISMFYTAMKSGSSVHFGSVFLFSAIVTLFILVTAVLVLVQMMAFSTNLKFKSAFDFELIKKLICKDFKFFIHYNVKVFLASLVFYALAIVLAFTIVGIIAFPGLGFLYTVVTADLSAQYIKELFAVK